MIVCPPSPKYLGVSKLSVEVVEYGSKFDRRTLCSGHAPVLTPRSELMSSSSFIVLVSILPLTFMIKNIDSDKYTSLE